MTEKKSFEYDGLEVTKNGSTRSVSFRIDKAMEISNPRSVFLNGQLFIENQCDSIVGEYFEVPSGLKLGVFHKFLKSKCIDFFSKIYLMRHMLRTEVVQALTKEDLKPKPLIDNKIIISLQAIGAVRNAFQHHLVYSDALGSLTDGNKFQFTKGCKKLNQYNSDDEQEDVKKLVNDFRIEVINVYNKLHDLLHELGGKRAIVK